MCEDYEEDVRGTARRDNLTLLGLSPERQFTPGDTNSDQPFGGGAGGWEKKLSVPHGL